MKARMSLFRRLVEGVVVIASVPLLWLSLAALPAFAMQAVLTGNPDRHGALESGFLNPPNEVKARTWWHWMNGNITREGITADLESMARGGLGGAYMFDVSGKFAFNGPVAYLSDEWLALARHAAAEADRLGLELGFHNCSGWSSSGGPWVTPGGSMQVLTTSRTLVSGPAVFSGELPLPPVNLDFYEDTAVIAYPVNLEQTGDFRDLNPKVTSNDPMVTPEALIDGNHKTVSRMRNPSEEDPVYIVFEFPEPFTACAFSLDPGSSSHGYHGLLQVSDDGVTYRTVRDWWKRHARGKRSFSFPQETARFYRIVFQKPNRTNYVYMNLAEIEFTSELQLDDWEQKAAYEPYPQEPVTQIIPPDSAIPPDQIINLTAMVHNGRLEWTVPSGDWAILRMGRTPLGSGGNYNNPASFAGGGLECDKFSEAAVREFWAGGPAKILEALDGYVGTTLTEVLIDSYERGQPNWTGTFPDEFERLRGYSMIPYLPAMTGRIVGSVEQSERFLWDVRRTIADLFSERYSGTITKLAQENKLRFGVEAAGFVADNLSYVGKSDMPISVQWVNSSAPKNSYPQAIAAHVYGRRINGGEVMTAQPLDSRWTLHPYAVKALGDAQFCGGINKFMFHTFAHQPWTHVYGPGMTAGQWGSHFDRGATWWDQGLDWRIYLARCQYLLQQGLHVADGLFFVGETVPVSAPVREGKKYGYKHDSCNADVILNRLSVKDGRLFLPEGGSYAFLDTMKIQEISPAVMRKLRELVNDGAVLSGPRPTGAPGLSGYPQSVQEVVEIANELWGDCDGVTVRENRFGKGLVLCGMDTDSILDRLSILPDFEHDASGDIRFVHRTTDDADIYFISNQDETFVQTRGIFRVSGKVPELWHADSGETGIAPLYEEVNGRTAVELSLQPRGSVFVIFRKASAGTAHMVSIGVGTQTATGSEPPWTLSVNKAGQAQIEVREPGTYEFRSSDGRIVRAVADSVPAPVGMAGSWELTFPPGTGAPAGVTLPALICWTEHSDPGVRYFSGTATYKKTITLPPDLFGIDRKLYLDLGDVKQIAKVTLNGKPVGGYLWKPPFRADITAAAKAGENDLEIELTNLWPNRLIGDEQLPADCEWNSDGGIKKLPDWFVSGQKSPSGRLAFTTWRHWNAADKLLPSGLLGPVQVFTSRKLDLIAADHPPVEPPKSEADKLIALWRFDGDLKDATTNQHHGTAMGTVSFAAGKYGQAATFTVNSAVRVEPHAMLDLTNTFTIACWIHAVSNNTKMSIVTKGPSPGFPPNYPGNYQFRLQNEQDPRRLQFVWDPHAADAGVNTRASTGRVTPEVWTHVAITVESSGAYRFYINGASAGSGTITTGLTANNYAMLIGNLNAVNLQEPFCGQIDEVAIFNTALSAGEISGIMNGDFSAYLSPAE